MMRVAIDLSEKGRLYRFIVAWGIGVRWASIVLSCTFIPIMIFGFIVSPDARIVALIALPVLILIAWWNLRALRVEKRARDGSETTNGQPR